MRRLVATLPGWLLELIPILLGLVVGYFYFIAVLPEAKIFGSSYLLAFLVIFLLTRIPRALLARRHLTPILRRYKAAKRDGRRCSRFELGDLYIGLAAYVPKAQVLSASLWVFAFVLLAVSDQLWMVGTRLSFLGLLFGILVVGSIALTLNYFILKERLRPLLEDVLSQLEHPPDVRRWRVGFLVKMLGFVTSIVALAMLSFGLLLYSLMHRSAESMALSGGARQMAEFTASANSAEAGDALDAVAERFSSTTWAALVLAPDGRVLSGCPPECHGGKSSSSTRLARTHVESVAKSLLSRGGAGRNGEMIEIREGHVLVSDLTGGRVAGIVLHPRAVAALMRPVLAGGVVFLVATLLVLTGYLALMGVDHATVLKRMQGFSSRLASGDLRKAENIWNDDELGIVAENLGGTHHALRRMVGQAKEAASTVEQEAAASFLSVANLREESREQVRLSGETARGVAGVASGIRSISQSMEAVSGATQDVSSTILEMQASVDELANNAESLSLSVEKSVASSNEIAASSQEVSDSSLALKSASQESVSFFAELDASLEETRRNAETLSKVSGKVTHDAEGGFGAVAAVEEEILRIRSATEKSRGASERLRIAMERIGRIVDVIQDVTEQTNLLALNASIIAAGAGEHGKAFGVVASQVRELSGRTAAQAAEIRGLVRTLLESGREMSDAIHNTEEVVSSSALLSRQAGESLRTILESASSQEEMSQRIASAMEELSLGGQASQRNFRQINEMAEGIQSATAEQARATRLLNREAETVRGVADLLRNATQEQARGGRLISDAVTRITSDGVEVAEASAIQGEEAAFIDRAVSGLAEAAQRTGNTVEQLAETVDKLQRASEALGEEIRQFSL